MPRKLHLLLFGIFLFALSSAAFPQTDAGDVQVQLSLCEGKTIYRKGEPIQLNLIFTARKGEYNLLINSEETAKTPDEIVLSPSDGAFGWRAQYERGKYFMNDYFGYAGLAAAKPENIELVLNDFFRFDKPGKYLVYVKTKRLFAPKGKSQFDGNLLPLVSNAVEFEIAEMSEIEEQAEIERLGALIDSKNDWREQNVFSRNLSLLTGDAATVEKVKRYLNPGNYQGNYQSHMRTGLLMTRNKALAIKLLEDALRDPGREVEYNLPYILGELRWLQEDTNSPFDGETDERKLRERRDKRTAEIVQTYFDELLKSLSNRTAKSRLLTAYTIFTRLPNADVSSAAFSTTKNILLQNFDDLTPYGKDQLLGYFWEKIKTPTLLPSIEKILAGGEPVSYWSFRNLALKRLIEFDERKARSIVIDEIRNPDSRISYEVLSSLNDEFLPEVDSALLDQIRKLTPTKDYALNQKLMLAARYATENIYQELSKIYKTQSSQWSEETQHLLLGYLIRHNEKEGTALLEQKLAEASDQGDSGIFYNLGRINFPEFPKGLEKLLQKRLDGNDAAAAGTASYYLSVYGSGKNKKLIEERYQRWHKEWRSKAEQLNNPNADTNIRNQRMFEVNIISSLTGSKKWKLSVLELKKLESMCLTPACRQYFSVPKL